LKSWISNRDTLYFSFSYEQLFEQKEKVILMNGNEIFKIFTKKIYWIICLTVPFLLSGFLLISKVIFNQTDIEFTKLLLGFVGGVVTICSVTLSISLIVYTIRDLIVLREKERWFLIILLILFTLRAIMGFLRSQ